jgi:type III secretory pathway component EscV
LTPPTFENSERRAFRLASHGKFLNLSSDHVYNATATLGSELNCTRCKSEQSVVLSTADVHAGVEVSAALTDDDLARVDDLAAVTLDT